MKPHVLCHTASSIDGRALLSRWQPRDCVADGLFAQVYGELGGEAWIVGRTTGEEYAKGLAYPDATDQTFPRESWFARGDAACWAVILDPLGKIAWGRREIEGDPILVVLREDVSDAHLAGLRAEGVSYLFAGRSELDLGLLLEKLGDLGVRLVRVEGGGVTNGAFLRAGLVDEISLLLFPAVDGASGGASVFHSGPSEPDARAPLRSIELVSHRQLPGGAMWLRYRVTNGRPSDES
ncbi:2-hydroxy-3-oxopropionate reductase [Aureimonas endophytica]|uniref:2-hydroxy-3-oxopropionate reductase n=1 Tax=Aureimonas endophytica TaxID=2027858 RepID=A0A917E3V7_9HYPH|nr:dihydrofolate reductase family protein [Aureimonas endophytica]GGE02363.1 2-hydroxy-3-oxopropionate reductase [Aureimonas endophytica]